MFNIFNIQQDNYFLFTPKYLIETNELRTHVGIEVCFPDKKLASFFPNSSIKDTLGILPP